MSGFALVQPSAALILLCHILVGVALLAVGLRRDRPVASLVLPALLGLSAGPLGLVVALVLGAVLRRLPRDAPSEDWLALLHGRGRIGDRRLTDRVCDDRIRQPQPGALASLYDVQRFGGVTLRQRVVATVVRSFDPGLATVIARALTDPDQSIRAQAAAAATDYQNNFTARRHALDHRVATGDTWARRDLALLLADNAEVVLFSETVRGALRTEAIALLYDLRDTLGTTAQLDRRLAQLLVADRQPAAAADLLAARSDADTGDDETLVCHLDALFRSGEIDQLRRTSARWLAAGRSTGPKLAALVAFWGGEPAIS